MAKASKAEQADAIATLREFLPVGTTVYSVVREVARSGMSRKIDFYTISDGRIVFLTGAISRACGYTRTDRGLRVSGCGMDMCFAVVYDVASTIHGKGDALRSEVL